MAESLAQWLPHLNASLNAVAAALLCVGFVLIKSGRERAHRRVMITCFAVSCLFLTSYLVHKWALLETIGVPNKAFPRDESIAPAAARTVYFFVLATHLVGAILVPPLAITTIVLGLRGRRAAHRRVARWTLPIWFYVSVTGIIVYWMLYQAYAVPYPKAIEAMI
jgi:uncharacterized membrane protein YozB (DUF420 family)